MDAAGRGRRDPARRFGGEAFETESTPAVTIRRDADLAPVVIEGPFTGSDETLGGFILIKAEGMQEAIEVAKSWPVTRETLEIRPLWEAAENSDG
ncbi:YciI family protein [Amycolatopsis sp. QT-25]|uniref:YciI family protein n=1 Tax=Amycolatopsis sp. QT-25 TaxID=3034022 RepID=UPI0023EC384C|nr:YciI family protein [Amycolatopsis sp. QT-25]WET81603.1 YciI family protein [Amycolatopsis sp. QT-25]